MAVPLFSYTENLPFDLNVDLESDPTNFSREPKLRLDCMHVKAHTLFGRDSATPITTIYILL